MGTKGNFVDLNITFYIKTTDIKRLECVEITMKIRTFWTYIATTIIHPLLKRSSNRHGRTNAPETFGTPLAPHLARTNHT